MAVRLQNNKYNNYLEVYLQQIAPKLSEIDLFIKTAEWPVSISNAAAVLDISTREAVQISGCSHINKSTMMDIMAKASSNICMLYQREVSCGSPLVYTRRDIAYIYNLDMDIVNHVCDLLHIRELTAFTLPILFAHIPVAAA